LVRVRAIVAHDSYERLVEVICEPKEHFSNDGTAGLGPLNKVISEPTSMGLSSKDLIKKAKLDPGIVEFQRFYDERLDAELPAIENDERKTKKLTDDLTTRYEFALVGLEGVIRRQLKTEIRYKIGEGAEYSNIVTIIPSKEEMLNLPKMAQCEESNRSVPENCLSICDISGKRVMRYLLIKSAVSDRSALPEYVVECGLTHKKVLNDEVLISAVTGNPVIKTLLKKSAISGKLGEPDYFGICDFTGVEALKEELGNSEVSKKIYRLDQELKSDVSGKKGHKDEFIRCTETGKHLLEKEAEKCEITGKLVMPGILEACEITHKKVMPSELEKSSVSGKKALKKFFVTSSISSARLLEDEAIQSVTGSYCSPKEAKTCTWSSRKSHPEDLKTCHLTGLPFHTEFMTTTEPVSFEVLVGLLNGLNRKAEKSELWTKVTSVLAVAGHKTSKVEASEVSPDGNRLAVCAEIRSLFGLKTRCGGFIYSIPEDMVIGRIVLGKRDKKGWVED
jgi:hypothetical protein